MRKKVNHHFIHNLTGVYDKEFFLKTSHYILQLALRHEIPFSFCVIDIDDLQKVKTAYSHGIGNQILESITQTVAHHCRESDIIAYLEEGKIGLLLNNISGIDAQIFLNEIRKEVECYEHTFIEKKVRVTISIGVCMVDRHESTNTMHQIYSKAMAALSLAKNKGKNRIETY